MKFRAYLAGTFACLAITFGWVAGCSSKSSPTGPTVVPPAVRALTVKGQAALTAPTQSVTQDTEHVDVRLTPNAPSASLGGVYSLTFSASSSCNLPDDAVKRTYTATIDQKDAALTIVLSDAQFGSSGQRILNRFSGRVLGKAVYFTLSDPMYYGFYYGAGFVEKLADNRYLSLGGTAEATATDAGMSAAFAGVARISNQANGSSKGAVCAASDHRLVFTRTATTASHKRF